MSHQWDRDGERCVKCGAKDWMEGPCSTSIPSADGPSEEAIRLAKDMIAEFPEQPCTVYREILRLAGKGVASSETAPTVEFADILQWARYATNVTPTDARVADAILNAIGEQRGFDFQDAADEELRMRLDHPNIPPTTLYVWLVPSEEVQEQPGSWRIRKWDTEPFPEGKAFAVKRLNGQTIEQWKERAEISERNLAESQESFASSATVPMTCPWATVGSHICREAFQERCEGRGSNKLRYPHGDPRNSPLDDPYEVEQRIAAERKL